MSLLKIININDPGTGVRFGGDDLDTVNRLLSGEDLGKLLKIENPIYFGGANKVRILRPNGVNYVSINTEAEAANRSLLIKSFGADTYLVVGTDLLVKANLHSQIAYKDENTWLTDPMVSDVAFSKITGQIAMSQITDNSITNAKLVQIIDKAKLHSDIVYTTDNQSLTTKSMSAKTSTFEYLRKFQSVEAYGDVQVNAWDITGRGHFEGIQAYGDVQAADNDSTGYWVRLLSKAAAGEFAGLAHFADINNSFRRDKSGWVTGKQQTYASDHPWTNQRFIFGFWDQRTLPPDSNDLIASNQNGFMIVFRSGVDTNYRILHNDATAAAVDVNTNLAFPTSSTAHEYEIRLGASSIDWFIRNAISGTVLASGSINSRIPATSTKLYFYFGVQGNAKSILLRNAECKTGGH